MESLTGVYGGNQINWDYMLDEEKMDLAWAAAFHEAYTANLAKGLKPIDADEAALEEVEFFDSSGGTYLYGDWVQGDDGLWSPDPDGEFAALYDGNDNIFQVTWSRRILYGRAASPCYPQQVDARNDDTDRPEGKRTLQYYALPPRFLN